MNFFALLNEYALMLDNPLDYAYYTTG